MNDDKTLLLGLSNEVEDSRVFDSEDTGLLPVAEAAGEPDSGDALASQIGKTAAGDATAPSADAPDPERPAAADEASLHARLQASLAPQPYQTTGLIELADAPAEAAPAAPSDAIATNDGTGAFVEEDGIVVIEMESADNLPGSWKNASTYNRAITKNIDNAGNATGGDFIVWEGGQFFGEPGTGVITYEVQITKTGIYSFEWRSQVGLGSNTSEHNDTWLKIEADQFYGHQASDDTYVRPVGAPAGSFPPDSTYPNGSSKDGWFKVYHGTQNWNWGGWTSDHDGHRIKAVFDTPGTYSIHLSARSSSHVIDRMVLWHDDVNGNVAKNLSRAESERVGETTPEPPVLPEPPSAAEAKIFLIDADDDTRKGEITDGASIDLSVLDGADFALEAETDPDDSVASVRMTYGTHVQVESVEPFALFGDNSGDFFGRALTAGAKTIKVELFSGNNATGALLGTTEIDFTVTGTPPSDPVEAVIYLIDADNDRRKGEITDGASIDLSVLDGAYFALEAVTDPDDSVASVRMTYGTHVQIDSVEPYALFGSHGRDFFGNPLTAGEKTITVELFSGNNATGTLLGTTEIDFTVTGTAPPKPPELPVDAPEFDADGLAGQADHIVFHFDGNNNDRDDISAIVIAALLAKAGGVDDKMTFLYGNNLSETNDEARMPALDAGGALAEKLGIEALNYQDNIAATTARLVEIISSGDEVLLIEGGPMEAVYRAMEQVDPSFHSNLTLLSHSTWNENRSFINLPGITQARTWADLKADFPTATYVDIRDQNDGHNNERGFNNRGWDWMDSSDEPLVQEARDIMQFAQYALNDPSDAGMLFYAMTGMDDAEPSHAKAFFEASDLFDPPTAPGPTGIVAGRFFVDADDDGQNDHDGSDPGVAGFTVQLRKDGAAVESTTTNANGWYVFEDVPVGDGYSVRFYHGDAGLDFAPLPGQSVGSSGNLNSASFAVEAGVKSAGIHAMFEAPSVETGRLEMGKVSLSQDASDSWINVTFEEAIENAVVVLGPPSMNGNSPVVTNLRSVTDTGFQMQIEEWDYLNGMHQVETVSWMAVSAGAHRLYDGTVIEAGVASAQNSSATSVSLSAGFDDAPVVFAQTQTNADSTPVTTRISDVDAGGFDVQLQEEQANDGLHASEGIGWIAIEEQVSVAFDHVGSVDADHGWSKLRSGDPAADDVFFADMQTLNGADTAALRHQERGNGILVHVQEEASADAETAHAVETVGYLVGSTGSFDLYA